MDKTTIVFICLGNYCRSPMAEAIFNKLTKDDELLDKFDVSSAGTKDWDIGFRPDQRVQKMLRENGYPLNNDKRARKISDTEIKNADYLVVMTQNIANDLGNRENVYLLTDFINKAKYKDIPDPYPSDTFLQAFKMIEEGIKAFYDFLRTPYLCE